MPGKKEKGPKNKKGEKVRPSKTDRRKKQQTHDELAIARNDKLLRAAAAEAAKQKVSIPNATSRLSPTLASAEKKAAAERAATAAAVAAATAIAAATYAMAAAEAAKQKVSIPNATSRLSPTLASAEKKAAAERAATAAAVAAATAIAAATYAMAAADAATAAAKQVTSTSKHTYTDHGDAPRSVSPKDMLQEKQKDAVNVGLLLRASCEKLLREVLPPVCDGCPPPRRSNTPEGIFVAFVPLLDVSSGGPGCRLDSREGTQNEGFAKKDTKKLSMT